MLLFRNRRYSKTILFTGKLTPKVFTHKFKWSNVRQLIPMCLCARFRHWKSESEWVVVARRIVRTHGPLSLTFWFWFWFRSLYVCRRYSIWIKLSSSSVVSARLIALQFVAALFLFLSHPLPLPLLLLLLLHCFDSHLTLLWLSLVWPCVCVCWVNFTWEFSFVLQRALYCKSVFLFVCLLCSVFGENYSQHTHKLALSG